MKIRVHTEQQLAMLYSEIGQQYRKTGYLEASLSNARRRSYSQNSISHAWYEQISRELGQDSPAEVKAECKLRFGVPILRRDDDDFRESYDAQIKSLSYEQKLVLMKWVPITSLMNTGQLSEYLEAMQQAYAGTVMLVFPMEAAA